MASSALDVARGVQSSLAIKAPARVASTASNIPLMGLFTLDGVALRDGDRVLVAGNTNQIQNGVWNASPNNWRRAPDFDSIDDVVAGTLVRVGEGNTGQGLYFESAATPVPGVTPMTFAIDNSSAALAFQYAQQAISAAAAAQAAAEAAGGALPINTQIHAATAKSALSDNDELGIADSDATYAVGKVLWSVIKSSFFTALGPLLAGGTTKATPVDADSLALSDSADTNKTKKFTWANLKATLNAYFKGLGALALNTGDILYASGGNALGRLAAGVDGQVLSLASGLPAWGNVGGLTLLGTMTMANGSTSQTITGLPTIYKALRLVLTNVATTSTGNNQLLAVFSSTNGALYGPFDGIFSQTTGFSMSISGEIRITRPDETAEKTLVGIVWQQSGSGQQVLVGANKETVITSPTNALAIAIGVGTFTGGTIQVYGEN